MSKRQLILVSAIVVLLLAAVGGWLWLGRGSGEAGAATTAGLAADTVHPDDHVLGSANAPVTIVEYFAQACSVCAHYNEAVFPQLKAKYIDTGKVRYVMRLFPLFPIDGPSHKLALCLPKEQFFQATDLLFRNQPQWDTAEYKDADPQGLTKMARLLGMTEAQAQSCMGATAQDDHINAVAQEGMQRYDIQGTPTIVIDFKKADLPRLTWEESDAAITAALAAKGVK
jgi:protein-disulfide isomerase